MTTLFDAARQMRLSAPANARLEPGMTPRIAVQTLLDDGLAADALSLLARLLPHRYTVAWVCQCASREALGAHDREGVAFAEAWVRAPGEAQRAAAALFASEHRYRTIGAWACASAGWTGGNLNPRNEQPTPPPEHLSAIAATAAVTYMAALVPAQIDARRTAFVRDALGLLGIPNGMSGATQ